MKLNVLFLMALFSRMDNSESAFSATTDADLSKYPEVVLFKHVTRDHSTPALVLTARYALTSWDFVFAGVKKSDFRVYSVGGSRRHDVMALRKSDDNVMVVKVCPKFQDTIPVMNLSESAFFYFQSNATAEMIFYEGTTLKMKTALSLSMDICTAELAGDSNFDSDYHCCVEQDSTPGANDFYFPIDGISPDSSYIHSSVLAFDGQVSAIVWFSPVNTSDNSLRLPLIFSKLLPKKIYIESVAFA